MYNFKLTEQIMNRLRSEGSKIDDYITITEEDDVIYFEVAFHDEDNICVDIEVHLNDSSFSNESSTCYIKSMYDCEYKYVEDANEVEFKHVPLIVEKMLEEGIRKYIIDKKIEIERGKAELSTTKKIMPSVSVYI